MTNPLHQDHEVLHIARGTSINYVAYCRSCRHDHPVSLSSHGAARADICLEDHCICPMVTDWIQPDQIPTIVDSDPRIAPFGPRISPEVVPDTQLTAQELMALFLPVVADMQTLKARLGPDAFRYTILVPRALGLMSEDEVYKGAYANLFGCKVVLFDGLKISLCVSSMP